MKKITVLFLSLLTLVGVASAQTQQQLLEAYRNGTLTQSQIDAFRQQQQGAGANAGAAAMGGDVRRTRQDATQTGANAQMGQRGQLLEAQNANMNMQLGAQEREAREIGYYDMTGRYIPGVMYTIDKNGTFRFNTNDPRYKLIQLEKERKFDPRRGRLTMKADSLKRDSMLSLMPELREMMLEEATKAKTVFGQDMFNNAQMTFEPNLSIATPDNYVLGAGDEIIVDVWGNSQMTHQSMVTPDGRIFIPDVGPVAVAGLTIEEATTRMRNALGAIYEGLYDGSVQMELSLSGIRSIQVNVMGEVGVAGTYRLPSLATLFHALYMAGGVSEIGTLRSIKVYRGGKLYSDVDVYDYILNGKSEGDVALRDGDLIIVSPYGNLVEVTGEVKRPMFYELRAGESVADLIGFAGDFTSAANRDLVSVTRRQGGQYKSFSIDGAQINTFKLEDGDEVSVAGSIDRYENRVEVLGAVYREGYYALDDNVKSVKQLIARADGLREDAFMARAVLYREKSDWTMEAKAIDLAGLMSGRVADIPLRANDLLIVASVSEMQQEYAVTIFGAVSRPDTYPFAEKMTVEDLIIASGGLLESASTANVTVTRRIKDPKSMQVSETLFETFTVDINDGLEVDGSNFELQPFDQVYVRRSPVYITQSSVTVQGEVAFAGNYPLSRRNMRLSEVISAAGGTNPGAFIEGAYLLRRMTDEERQQSESLQEMIDKQAASGRDSLRMIGVKLDDVYTVGIDLATAMSQPNTDADIVLRDGDQIVIPEYNGTVRVMGAVLYPNSVTFKEDRNLKYYVKSAGGFDNRARKNRAFVIYMNGMVDSGMSAKVRPGSIVIIPSKTEREPVNWAQIVQMLSSTASMAAVVVSTINLAAK